MSISDEKTKQFAANSIFPSFFLGAFGSLLAQAWGAQMHGSWRFHAVLGIPGAALIGVALYRARLHWFGRVDEKPGRTTLRRWCNAQDVFWYILLFCTGMVLAFFSRSAFWLGVVAPLMYLIPWSKIPVCRRHFLVASVVALAGEITGMVVYSKPLHPLHFAVVAWMVLIAPTIMSALVFVSLPDTYRISERKSNGNSELDARVPAAS